MKFLIFLIVTALLFVGIIFGIGAFLAPNDLAGCNAPTPGSAKCAPADAIIAISGGDTTARTAEAINLYLAGWAPKLLLSGAALDQSGPSNAQVMKKQALAAGVPASAIITDSSATDTTANASDATSLLGQVNRLIVVTSPYHQRRAGLEFAKQFGKNVTVINHPTTTDELWPAAWWLNPLSWTLALSELGKTVVVMVQR